MGQRIQSGEDITLVPRSVAGRYVVGALQLANECMAEADRPMIPEAEYLDAREMEAYMEGFADALKTLVLNHPGAATVAAPVKPEWVSVLRTLVREMGEGDGL